MSKYHHTAPNCGWMLNFVNIGDVAGYEEPLDYCSDWIEVYQVFFKNRNGEQEMDLAVLLDKSIPLCFPRKGFLIRVFDPQNHYPYFYTARATGWHRRKVEDVDCHIIICKEAYDGSERDTEWFTMQVDYNAWRESYGR